MKYSFLRYLLKGLVYLKRLLWWLSAKSFVVPKKITGLLAYPLMLGCYKLSYLLKRLGVARSREWIWQRESLQTLVFVALLLVGLTHTKLLPRYDLLAASQKTIAYAALVSEQQLEVEEVNSTGNNMTSSFVPTWRQGSVGNQLPVNNQSAALPIADLATVVAGGSALSRPLIIPGQNVAGNKRTQEVVYQVEAGDSLGIIAQRFGISIDTLLWANNLSLRSLIRPGDALNVPPTTGVMHKIKSGDTLSKLASRYQAKVEDIVNFNKLREDGTDLAVGERIMVPGGTPPAVAPVSRPTAQFVGQVAAPPPSTNQPGLSGFIWPSSTHTITQYYGWRHTAIDVGGPFASPIYAAKAGTIEVAQCGWNGGYGCYVIIDHGGGVETLYAHNSRLLVSPGEFVERGQTVALMGNTGRVYGRTGIHLHFEVRVRGSRLNPLKYVR